MATVTENPLAVAMQAVPPRKERLQKAFNDLELQRAALASCTVEWKELEEHFAEVEIAVQKRLEDLAAREKSFEAKTREAHEALDKREEAVSAREQASLSRVQEQKDSAIAAIFEEKRKWLEERSRLEAEAAAKAAQNAITESPVVNHVNHVVEAIKAETPVAVVSNGHTSAQAMEVDVASPKPAGAPAATTNTTTTVIVSVKEEPASDVVSKDAGKTDTASTPPVKAVVPEVRVRPQLKSLCENMDGDGLRKYIVDHRKDVGALRAELPSALQCAIDPARLVLSALDGYHHPEPGTIASNQGADKKESGASANRRACILLLECLAVVLADPVLGADHPVVPSNIKESAKEVADQWRSKMTIHGDASSGNSLDAQAFLQLLATFGIASEYNDDELCKLVTAVARRRQSPALCRSLGLSAKIPDVVDRLAKEGKQIEALSFAHSFGIMDRVQPVPLLKAYLKEARKTAQNILKNGNSSAAAQNDATMKELGALKAVLKCIEEYQLESQYPSGPLTKRVAQLEKAKSDRKRAAVAVKAQTKRPRASGGTGAGYGAASAAPNERNYYRGSERGQYGAGVGVSSYSLAAQSNYDRRAQGAYSTTYTGGTRSPVSLSSSYIYSAEGLGSPVYGSGGYSNPSATYSSYQFGSGLPPPPPAYQASFLH
ncbi:hypothetical protein R1flu_020831 [Riccia fluitans]|uniref:FRIGIDA-like protein n=1 Tax=Riccia fluitans TaxID=41844 RepID=A0ABD1ZMM4_9MARC